MQQQGWYEIGSNINIGRTALSQANYLNSDIVMGVNGGLVKIMGVAGVIGNNTVIKIGNGQIGKYWGNENNDVYF